MAKQDLPERVIIGLLGFTFWAGCVGCVTCLFAFSYWLAFT